MERIVIAMFLFTVRHRHPRQIHSIRTLIPSLYRNQFNITLQSDQQMVSSLQFHRLKTVRPCWIFPMSSTFPTHLKPADLMCTRKMRNYYVSVIWQQGGKRWTQKQKQTSKRHPKMHLTCILEVLGSSLVRGHWLPDSGFVVFLRSSRLMSEEYLGLVTVASSQIPCNSSFTAM